MIPFHSLWAPRRRFSLPRPLLAAILAVGCLVALAWRAAAFSLLGPADRWPANTAIVLSLQLGDLGRGRLQDGSANFDAVATQAATLWNEVLGSNVRLVPVVSGQSPGSRSDSLNSVFFASTLFGQGFGDAVAVTTSSGSETFLEECDVVFNTRYAWDAYRGPVQSGSPTVYDLRRVALHEFGHVLGLGHPDQAGQGVAAVMNSRVSNVDQLYGDDIEGAQSIYGRPGTLPAPRDDSISVPLGAPMPGAIAHFYGSPGEPAGGGGEAMLDGASGYAARYDRFFDSGTQPHRTVHLFSFFAADTGDLWNLSIHTPADPSLSSTRDLQTGAFELTPAGQTDSAAHAVFVARRRGPFGVPVTRANLTSGQLLIREVTYENRQLVGVAIDLRVLSGTDPAPRSLIGQIRFNAPSVALPAARIVNLSTRVEVGLGPAQAIAGFVFRDPAGRGKQGLVRALGASLANYGVTGVLGDSTLTLNDAGGHRLDYNDDWANPDFYPSPQAPVFSANLAPPGRTESILFRRFSAGAFTAVVGGYDNGSGPETGVALVELYDLEIGTEATLLNVSTRGRVGAAGKELIGGFAIMGPGTKKVVVRALGPSLTAFGVAGALADPTVTVIDAAGATIATNDNWQTDPASAQVQARGLAPSNPAESAVALTLVPGTYTAVVRGIGNTTGVALVEVYDAD